MIREFVSFWSITLLALAALGMGIVAAADPPYGGISVKTVAVTLVDSAGQPIGTVRLNQDAAGVVEVRIGAAGLPAGAHGVHIHAVGRCEGPAFTSAGGHFNPTGKKHGLAAPDGPHGGDLTAIGVTFAGTGIHTVTNNRISLTGGPTSIFDADGSALIVHAADDDQLTDPTGNSGARIACAVIAAAQPAAASPTAAPSPAPAPPATGTGASDEGGRSIAILAALAAVIVTAAAIAALAARPTRRSA